MADASEVGRLVGASAGGSEAAWSELVRRYSPLVMAVTRSYQLTTEDARDVSQTVWLRLVENLANLREPEALPGWLATTTHRECQRRVRRERQVLPVDPQADGAMQQSIAVDHDADILRAELRQALRDGLAELPERDQLLLRLRAADPRSLTARSASSWACGSGVSAPPSAGAWTSCGRLEPCEPIWPRWPRLPAKGKVVTSVSSPRWTDDELLEELRAALQEERVDESLIRAAEAAFTWRVIDAELELLYLDAGSGLTAGALVRDSGSHAPRTLVFHGERLSVEIEIDRAGIIGQLTPPQPGQVTLLTAGGPQATTQTDELGCFAFPDPPSGPLRLECRLGADHFVTEWVTG